MALLFNSILAQEGIAPAETILVRHQDMRAEKGRTPFELWRFDRPAFDAYQSRSTRFTVTSLNFANAPILPGGSSSTARIA
jgi:hypothetical protein